MLHFSKYNIFSKIRDSKNYFIINLLTKNADILSPEQADEIKKGKYSNTEELVKKGYLLTKEKEDTLYKNAYLDFIDARDQEEKQIFFVPNYDCNFSCSYCYQSEYDYCGYTLNKEVIDAFFSYIDKKFQEDKKYITIFGGEPLLPPRRVNPHFSQSSKL